MNLPAPSSTWPSPSTAPAGTRPPGASPTPGPPTCSRAGYWADLVAEAERGLLDFVTIEDSLALQSERRRQPDERTDQVRGRLDAVLIAARVAPLTRHIGLVPTVMVTHTEPFHVSKAIATLDYVSTGRAGVRVQVSARPDEAAHVRPPHGRGHPSRRDVGVGRAGRRRAVRRGRRLRRGPPAAVGQLGGRRRDPRRRHRPVRRPRQAALHRLRGPLVLGARARRSPRGRRRASRSSPRWPTQHRAVPAGRRAAPTSASSPRTTPPRPRDHRRDPRGRRRQPARAGSRLHGVRRPGGLPRRRRRTGGARAPASGSTSSRASAVRQRRARSSPAPPGELADLLQDWQAAGLAGFRLRPAALPHDLTPDHRRPGARAAAPRRCSARATRPTPCAACSACARPANRYATADRWT